MNEGYNGKVAVLDLGNRSIQYENIPENIYQSYLGGSGLAAKFLMDLTGPETDPLGSENVIVFMVGPFTGTMVPASSRFAVAARSPLTGVWGESDCGGSWGLKLKKAGFDGLIIKGASEQPVFVHVRDNQVIIGDAQDLWGLDTYDLDLILKKKFGNDCTVAGIGPAGENMVRFSSIMTDGKEGRAAGRTGLGAVMGSKRLKAIIVQGKSKVTVFDEVGLRESVRYHVPGIVEKSKIRHAYGTSGGLETMERLGNVPIKNWQLGNWDRVQNISGQSMAQSILTGTYSCPTCPIGCGRRVKITTGQYAPVEGAGPEYETVSTLGALVMVDDIEAIAKANELCNRYGLDTISTGNAIGFAMEAFEKRILTETETDGLRLEWGNAGAVLETIRLIARRESFGRILGEGVKKAAKIIGKGSERFAVHVKGMEPPAHDPRAVYSNAVGFATSNRGACHLQAMAYGVELSFPIPEVGYAELVDRFQVEGKGRLTARMQNLASLLDSLKICKFIMYGGVTVTTILEWFNLVTGWGLTVEELLHVGERIYNLKRLYNVRLGVTRHDDVLPPRFQKDPRPTGGAAGSLPPLEEMLDEYYEYRGWSRDGIPSQTKMEELGLSKYAY